jgi:UDP-4-amino-4-deoxy-L-arabinose-oxoglutarate aminotransferase
VTPILHSKPWITGSDLASLEELMQSGMLAQGEKTAAFEAAIADWVAAKGGAVAVGSGSAAIVLALQALRIGQGDEVILPSYLCPKVAEAVVTVGATPVFCDIGKHWTLTSECVAPRMTPRTKAIIVPHLYGIFANVASFRRFGVPLIEDCAQAIGYRGRSPVAGDVAIFSFHPTKLITTGEGGMAAASDPDLVARMRALRDGERSFRSPRLFSPMPDLASALGLSQLAHYPAALDRRADLAMRYKTALEPLIPESFEGYPVRNNMYFRFPLALHGGVRRFQPLFAADGIRISNGVDALVHRSYTLPDAGFDTSVALFDSTVSLPLYPALTDEEHRRCVDAAIRILGAHASTAPRNAAAPSAA